MTDELTIPIAAVSGGGISITAIIGWFLRSHNKRLEAIESDNRANAAAAQLVATDLGAYKLDSEKRFAKEDSVQATLARLHDRLDLTATQSDVRELRDDIKVLIGKTGAV